MRQARPYAPVLSRQTYRGGWALGFTSATCPAETSVRCQSNPGYNLNCCPNGQFCYGSVQPYCCPTDDDCGPAVKNVPICANGTWNMFRNEKLANNDFFCCPQGYVGVLPQRGGSGVCELESVNIPKSQLATMASQIGGTSVAGTGSVPTATGSVPTTGSRTLVTATTGRVTGTPTSTSVPGGQPEPQTSSSSPLSTGAIVGIAVGAAGFLLLFALILWLHRRSIRKRSTPQPAAVYHDPTQQPFNQEYSKTAEETQAKQTGFAQPTTPSTGYGYPAPHGASDVDANSRAEMEAPAGGWGYHAGGRPAN